MHGLPAHKNDKDSLGSVFIHAEVHMESYLECLPTATFASLLELSQRLGHFLFVTEMLEMEKTSLLSGAL